MKNIIVKFLLRLPSTRLFRADRIFSLRENFLLRSAYGRLWRHPAIRTLRNPAEKGIDYGVDSQKFICSELGSYAGFGLLEVIVAVGIWVILASAGVAMTTGSLRVNLQSTDNEQASLLAGEGLDAVRAIKKIGWATPFLATTCTTGCGVATTSGTWEFSGTNNLLGKFTRQVFVTAVNRDTSGNIVTTGGTADADTYRVESKVTWQRTPVVTGVISLVSYLTNYVRKTIGNWALPLVEGSLNFGGNNDVIGFVLFGNYLFTIRPGSTNDLVVVDVSNTTAPIAVGSLNITGTSVTGIVADGSYVYLSDANNSAELRIINVTNPLTPVQTYTFDVFGNANANGLYRVGNILYLVRSLSTGAQEFVIIDVTNKTAPIILGGLDLNGTGNQVFVMGNYAYVADADNATELQIINISNPTLPILTGTLDLAGNNDALSVTGFGSTLLVGRVGGTVAIVSVNNPALPTLVSTYSGSGGDVNAISLGNGNNYAFLATTSTTQEFQVVDISNLTSPTTFGSINMVAGLDWVMYDPTRDRAFCGSRNNADEIYILKPSP